MSPNTLAARRYAPAAVVLTILVLAITLAIAQPSLASPTAGSFSGRVVEKGSGQPIADARVHVDSPDHKPIVDRTTNENGEYSLGNMPAGQYIVHVIVDGYGWMYYNQGCDDPDLDLVTITDGQHVDDINFELTVESTASGHVYAADGETPIAGATVDVYPERGGLIRRTTTAGDGSYTVGGLTTCAFLADAKAEGYAKEYYKEASSRNDAMTLQVTQPNPITDINFTLDKGLEISGRVVDYDNNQPIANAEVTLNNYDAGVEFKTNTDSSGQFAFDGAPPGDYWTRVTAESYASSYWDVSSREFIVQPGQPVTDLLFKLRKAAYVQPVVYQAGGMTPLAGMRIRAGQLYHGQFWNSTSETTGSDGKTPNPLAVPANMDVYLRAHLTRDTLDYMATWYNEQGGAVSLVDAQTINLTPGQTRDVQFKIEKAPTATISPESGGIVSLETSYIATVTFPGGAVETSSIAKIQPDLVYWQPPLASFPDAFYFGLSEVSTNAADELQKPVTIRIDYDDQIIPKGVDESDLAIYVWVHVDSLWWMKKLPTSVDTADNVLVAESDVVGSYQVMGSQPAAFMPAIVRP